MRFRNRIAATIGVGALLATGVGTVPATAAGRQVWGCPQGSVCFYSSNGWLHATPGATVSGYGDHKVPFTAGVGFVFNNQGGSDGATLCTAQSDCGADVAVNGARTYDPATTSTVRLSAGGGTGGEQAGARPAWSMATVDGAGDAFATFDFDWRKLPPEVTPGQMATYPDWPVNLIFVSSGRISTSKVKDAVRDAFQHKGGPMHTMVRDQGTWDEDSGAKIYPGTCGRDDDDNNPHFRVYAPDGEGSLTKPAFGNFVVATSHIDHRENCTSGDRSWTGRSEMAETYIAAVFAAHGYRVEWNKIPLHNAEDDADRFNNGYATVVHLD